LNGLAKRRGQQKGGGEENSSSLDVEKAEEEAK